MQFTKTSVDSQLSLVGASLEMHVHRVIWEKALTGDQGLFRDGAEFGGTHTDHKGLPAASGPKAALVQSSGGRES